MLKLTTDKHEASRGLPLSATAELLVLVVDGLENRAQGHGLWKRKSRTLPFPDSVALYAIINIQHC